MFLNSGAQYISLPGTATFACFLKFSINIVVEKNISIQEGSCPPECFLPGTAGFRDTYFYAGQILNSF